MVDQESPVEAVLKQVGAGIDSITAQILLRDSYETLYQIFDHDRFGSSRPLALVAMHPKENTAQYSKLYRTVYRYRQAGIKDLFQLSLVEFLNLPHELTELMFKIAHEEALKSTPSVEAAVRELDRMGRS